MSQQSNSSKSQAAASPKSSNLFSVLVIPIAFVVSLCIYLFVLGDGSHFEANGHPKTGDYFGMVYKGGFIVPILMTCFLTLLIFCIERYLTINKASGSGSVSDFVRKVKFNLESNDVDGAIAACDKQKGSVANVVRSGLQKYKEMQKDTSLDTEQKVLSIRKEIEESTSLELPMLEKNLVILATLASVATLLGLLGTVFGMIRSFAALGNSGGATDAAALSNGISEALINTALGITTSAIAIIMYNVFTTKIDKLTYGIDEAGFSIAETFAAKYK